MVLDDKKAGPINEKDRLRKMLAPTGQQEEDRRLLRLARFLKPSKHDILNSQSAPTVPTTSIKQGPFALLTQLENSALTLVGTCTTLEKSFRRLTSIPDPREVRPFTVLKKTLKLLKRKWKKNKDYGYSESQFRSLRQDILVQGIQESNPEFAIEVYETHARVCLEANDFAQFSQCQTQLSQLFEKHDLGSKAEFCAYKILQGCQAILGQVVDFFCRHPLFFIVSVQISEWAKHCRAS